MSFGNTAGPAPFGGMSPGDALGGGLTQTDPATGNPMGRTAQAPDQDLLFSDMPNVDQSQFNTQQQTAFNKLFSPIQTLEHRTPEMIQGYINTLRGAPGMADIMNQRFGLATSQPSTPPAQQTIPYGSGNQKMPFFGDGMTEQQLMDSGMIFKSTGIESANPTFRSPAPPAQQIQQIAQGQPTLVNQLAPPPAGGPVPGSSITQQPPPFPQPPRVNMDFLRQPNTTPPPAVQPPFSPPPRVNMDFLRAPVPQPQAQPRFATLNQNPAFNPQTRNANSLAQVLSIQQANPAFAPNRMMPQTQPRVTPAPRATFTPPALPVQIRQPAAGQTVPGAGLRPYTAFAPQPQPAPASLFAPRRTTPLPAPSQATQSRLGPKLTPRLRPTK